MSHWAGPSAGCIVNRKKTRPLSTFQSNRGDKMHSSWEQREEKKPEQAQPRELKPMTSATVRSVALCNPKITISTHLWKVCHMPNTYIWPSLIFTAQSVILWTDEETKALKHEATFPRSPWKEKAELGSESTPLWCLTQHSPHGTSIKGANFPGLRAYTGLILHLPGPLRSPILPPKHVITMFFDSLVLILKEPVCL